MSSMKLANEPVSSHTLSDLPKGIFLGPVPGDTISSLSWSPRADFLGVGSWDHKVRVYDVQPHATKTTKAVIDFAGTVLSCGWSLVSNNGVQPEVA